MHFEIKSFSLTSSNRMLYIREKLNTMLIVFCCFTSRDDCIGWNLTQGFEYTIKFQICMIGNSLLNKIQFKITRLAVRKTRPTSWMREARPTSLVFIGTRSRGRRELHPPGAVANTKYFQPGETGKFVSRESSASNKSQRRFRKHWWVCTLKSLYIQTFELKDYLITTVTRSKLF